MKREHLRRTIAIALVVGTILTLINQLDVFVKGNESALTWVKSGLNYCVPFVVSTWGFWPESGRKRSAASTLDRAWMAE
jgi:hypothetical protein